MNSLIKFEFEKKEVRTVSKDGEVWFVASDAAKILGLTNLQDSHLDTLDNDEKGQLVLPTLGGPQKMNVINESGLYGLTFRSRKPEAKRFRKWVTSEVLPSIRKHGAYVSQGITDDQLNSLINQLNTAKLESTHYKMLYENESRSVEIWKSKTEYGSISPRNGLPRLQQRCGAYCANRNFYNSVSHDEHQMTFDYFNSIK